MKKKMINEINSLIEKNNELFNQITSLSKLVESKDAIITELETKVKDLELALSDAKIRNLTFVNENENKEDINTLHNDFQDENVSENVETVETIETEYMGETGQSESLKSASSVIGMIVLECASLCNEFTDFGGQNAKDLVNLALGRTEVFKSEILNIMTENDDFSLVKSEVDLRVAEIREYFDLLRKQL